MTTTVDREDHPDGEAVIRVENTGLIPESDIQS
jgi:hypothetical protein